MTAPTPEQVDAVARVVRPWAWMAAPTFPGGRVVSGRRFTRDRSESRLDADRILTTTDPAAQAALAASLPAEVMLAALARREPECKECAAFIDSRCIGCKCCNHSWRDDCGCDLKSCGCGEARRDREAVTP